MSKIRLLYSSAGGALRATSRGICGACCALSSRDNHVGGRSFSETVMLRTLPVSGNGELTQVVDFSGVFVLVLSFIVIRFRFRISPRSCRLIVLQRFECARGVCSRNVLSGCSSCMYHCSCFGFGSVCSMDLLCVNRPIMGCLAATFDSSWNTASPLHTHAYAPPIVQVVDSSPSTVQTHTHPTTVSHHTIHARTPPCLYTTQQYTSPHTSEHDCLFTVVTLAAVAWAAVRQH